jgi:hypothetical protein
MKSGRFFLAGVIAVAGLAFSACGSSPSSPSGAGVTLHGVAMGQGVGTAGDVRAQSTASSAATSTVTVTVEGTSITTTISANGTFELDGLPAGTFTLVFSSNGVTIGTLTITSVPDQAEINLVVQISLSNVVMVKVEINGSDETENETSTGTPGGACLIAGGTVGSGIELEGSVSTVSGKTFEMAVNGARSGGLVSVDATGASYDCAGVKGTCDASLIVPVAKVHVSGTLKSCSSTAAQVVARQVKFQH